MRIIEGEQKQHNHQLLAILRYLNNVQQRHKDYEDPEQVPAKRITE
jgi:hypothetical protein